MIWKLHILYRRAPRELNELTVPELIAEAEAETGSVTEGEIAMGAAVTREQL